MPIKYQKKELPYYRYHNNKLTQNPHIHVTEVFNIDYFDHIGHFRDTKHRESCHGI